MEGKTGSPWNETIGIHHLWHVQTVKIRNFKRGIACSCTIRKEQHFVFFFYVVLNV